MITSLKKNEWVWLFAFFTVCEIPHCPNLTLAQGTAPPVGHKEWEKDSSGADYVWEAEFFSLQCWYTNGARPGICRDVGVQPYRRRNVVSKPSLNHLGVCYASLRRLRECKALALLANIFNTGQIIAKAIDVCQVVGG